MTLQRSQKEWKNVSLEVVLAKILI